MATENIIMNYDWTSSPRRSSFRKEAPTIWLQSYKLISNQILTAASGYLAVTDNLNTDAAKFYDDLYGKSTKREDNFIFPYFQDDIYSYSNTFGDTFQSGIGGSGGMLNELNEQTKVFAGGLANAYDTAKGSPGTYVETPMYYEYQKNSDPITITFILLNTENDDSLDMNLKLIKKLTTINKPLRLNSISMEPPRIYKVRLYGHRFIRWAYCSSFQTSLVGSRRMINGVITPEAYKISMTLQSLTLEHAGFVTHFDS